MKRHAIQTQEGIKYWYNNLGESQGNYTEWEKPVSNGYILYDSIHKTFSKSHDESDREQISGCQGLGGRGGYENAQWEHEFIWGVLELFCTLILVVVARLYICVKMHRAVYTHVHTHQFYWKLI